MEIKIPRRGEILAQTSKSHDFWSISLIVFLKKILPQKIRLRQRCEYAQKKAREKHNNNHNSWNRKIPDEAKSPYFQALQSKRRIFYFDFKIGKFFALFLFYMWHVTCPNEKFFHKKIDFFKIELSHFWYSQLKEY